MAAILKYLRLNSRLLLLPSLDSNNHVTRCSSVLRVTYMYKTCHSNTSICNKHYTVLTSTAAMRPHSQNIFTVNIRRYITSWYRFTRWSTCVMPKYQISTQIPVTLRLYSSSANRRNKDVVLNDDDQTVKDWLREMQDDFLSEQKDISCSFRSEIETETGISGCHKGLESRKFSTGGGLHNISKYSQSDALRPSSSSDRDKPASSLSEVTEIEDFSQTYDSYMESPEAGVIQEPLGDDIIDVTGDSDDDAHQSEEIAEKSVSPVSTQRGQTGVFDVEELVSFLYAENGQDICVIAVPEEYNYVDYMVLVSGMSPRHNKAIATNLQWHYKRKHGKSDPDSVKVEGLLKTTDWLALDLGNIALHIFKPETRELYDLETLWTVGAEYDDKAKEVSVDPFAFQYSLDIFESYQQNIPGLGSISIDRSFIDEDVSLDERFTEDMRPVSDRQDMTSSSHDNQSATSEDRNMNSASDSTMNTVNESDGTSDSESSSDSYNEGDTGRR